MSVYSRCVIAYTALLILSCWQVSAKSNFSNPPLDCDFEDSTFCGWENDKTGKATFKWAIRSGRTPSWKTGPQKDASGNGKYAYLEASAPRQHGDTVRLVSPTIQGENCMSFMYHMYGTFIGSLIVFTKTNISETVEWIKSGNHPDQWFEATVFLNSSVEYQIVLEGTRGRAWDGDVAIDNIKMNNGACKRVASQTLHAFTKEDASVFKLDRVPAHSGWIHQFTLQALQTKNSSKDVMYFVYPADTPRCAKSVTRQLSLTDLHCFPRDFFYASSMNQSDHRKILLVNRGKNVPYEIALEEYHPCCVEVEEQFFANVSLPQPSLCPPGWRSLDESCFQLHMTYWRTWSSHRVTCHNLGGHLGVLKDTTKQSTITAFFNEYLDEWDDFYLGAYAVSSGQWMTVKKQPFESTSPLWALGGPKPDGWCSQLYYSQKFVTDQMKDGWAVMAAHCFYRRRFVCQKGKKAAGSKCERGWFEAENICFRVFSERKSWVEARQHCTQQKGDLAIVDSDMKRKIIASQLPEGAYIGLGLLGSWRWLDGRNIPSINWNSGQPLTFKGGSCVVLKKPLRDWKLEQVSCLENHASVCETSERNFVAGQPTSHSSQVRIMGKPHHAVDGNVASCFTIKRQNDNSLWWSVILDRRAFLYKIWIKNRPDRGFTEIPKLEVILRNSEQTEKANCKAYDWKAKQRRLMICQPSIMATNVTLVADTADNLTLCEVLVDAADHDAIAHGVLQEVWYDIPSTTIESLQADRRYPSYPDVVTTLRNFDPPNEFTDYYGQRLTAYLQVPVSGNYTFYLACDDTCELWLDTRQINQPDSDIQDEERGKDLLAKLVEPEWTVHQQWDKYPDKQTSGEILLSKCFLYPMETLMKERLLSDSVSVGMRLPNGTYDRPIGKTHLFWVWPGVKYVDFKINSIPEKVSVKTGDKLFIQATYKYCCRGAYCPRCPIDLFIKFVGRNILVREGLAMDCRERNFTQNFETLLQEGIYKISITYAVLDSGTYVSETSRDIAEVYISAIDLGGCSFLSDLCSWRDKDQRWKIPKSGKGILAQVNGKAAVLESPPILADSIYQTTGLCLSFLYQLPTYSGSTLSAILVSSSNSTIWSLSGYQGSTWLTGQASFISKEDFKIVIVAKGESSDTYYAAVDNISISSKRCARSPPHSAPGFRCDDKSEFQCENGQCISKDLVCDGDPHCVDKSDERNCRCLTSQFECPTGECLTVDKLCDSRKNCDDRTDEARCGTSCSEDQFSCAGGGCVSRSETCDGKNNCEDGSDEPSICGLLQCSLLNLTCAWSNSSDPLNARRCVGNRVKCDFEDGLCGMKHESKLRFWQIGSGSTPTKNTGPNYDHTTFSPSGKYMFLEASDYKTGGTAVLASNAIDAAKATCVQFWYHMKGSDIGSLNVYIQTNGSKTLVWNRTGEQGDYWNFGQVGHKGDFRSYKVILEGVVGKGIHGDIAVDDFCLLEEEDCQTIYGNESPNCLFELDHCAWKPSKSWKMSKVFPLGSLKKDWQKIRGGYTYFQDCSTQTQEGKRCYGSLLSPPIFSEAGWKCIQFWYYLGSRGTSSLQVSLVFSKSQLTLWKSDWSRRKPGHWYYARLPIDSGLNSFQVLFEGRKDFRKTIIALDDVVFQTESCEIIPWQGDTKDFGNNPLDAKYFWKLDGTDKNIWLRGKASYQIKGGFTSLFLDGLDGHADIPAIDFRRSNFSIAIRFNAHDVHVEGHLISDWSSPFQFRVLIYDRTIQVVLRRSGHEQFLLRAVSRSYIKSKVWTHLVFVWDRSTLKGKIYIDGKLNHETASTYKGSDIDLNLTNHTLYELGFKKDTKDVFNGYLRDLAVFLRPLTPGEVSTLYSSTRALCLVRRTTAGDCCDFPFLHKNIQHKTCTSDDTRDLWCPAKTINEQPKSGTCAVNIGCLEFKEGFCGWVNSNLEATPWRLLMRAQMGSLTSQVKSYLQKTGWNEMKDSVGSNYQVDFAENHAAYVNVTDLPDLSEFTICLWMKTTDKTSAGAPIWYRVFYEMKRKYVTAIALLDYRGFYVYVGETTSSKTSSKANDGKWHHICLTWNSVSGRVHIYNDKAVLTGLSFSKAKIIPGGGEFIVGLTKEQARVDRKAGQFIGVISSVNIFNKALGRSDIEKMSRKCGDNLLNAIVPWSKFSDGVVGDVKFWKPAGCSDDEGYRYVAFGNSTSHSSQASVFESPMYERSNDSPFVCVRFRYLMYGPGTRVLRFYQQLDLKHQARRLMWAVSESNNTDETWKEGKVAVPSVTKYQVSFETDLANEPGYVSVRSIHIDKEYCLSFPFRVTEECNRNFTNSSGYIFSPHYPGYYPPLSHCRWIISVPQGNVIKLRFLEFQLEEHPSCQNDFIEIHSGQAKARRKIGRYCGQRFPAFLESLSNVLEITFISNANITRSGLKLHYTSWKAKTDQRDCIQYEDCPSSLECIPILSKTQEMRTTVKEGRELAAVPEKIPSNTAMILFQRNQISHLHKKTFFTLSWLKYMDLSENRIFRIEKGTFSNCYSLKTLKLDVNFISTLSGGVLENMKSLETLDCSSNLIKAISSRSLASLSSLTILSLRENRINRIDKDAFHNTTKLKHLYLQGNVLEELPDEVFVGLATLKILYLNNNRIKRLSSKTFAGLSSLEKLNLQGNSLSLKDFPPDVFDELPNLKEINLDEFILCCYAEKSQPGVRCNSPKDEFSSCSDLMKNRGVQVCVWILGLTALVGNLFVILMRVIVNEDNKVHSFLLTNLAISDLLMGVYLLTIAIKDAQWQGEYFKHDFDWRSGTTCVFTGVLSMVSSEVSVLMLTLITTDRLICIVFPFKVRRISRPLAYVVVGAIWVFGIMISVIPTLGFNYFHDHKRNVGFFGKSAVCLPLQLSTERQAGWEYAAGIFIALNFASFIYILVAYLVMFFTVKRVSNQVRSTKMKTESQMARRMMFIILTDFLCWMPVIILSLLSLLGKFYDPEKQAYVWIAVFVLPVNSSINPILYTFSTPLMRKKIGQQRDSLRGAIGRLGQRLRRFPGTTRGARLNSLLSLNTAKTSQTGLGPSSSQSSLPSASIRSSDERLQSEKDLKLIEIPTIFPQETSPSVGFVLAWSKGGKDTSVRLIKHFANERENTWRKEAELIEELNAGRGHPNILKYRWHCRTGECSFKIGRQSFPMLKESSFLLCYECTSSTTLNEYLQNSKIVLNLDALLAVAMDLICAIKYLEYNGVVHNNITTSSVLIGRGTRVPPITAVLGGFGSAQRISEDFPECSRNSHTMKNILGKNILQFGFVLSELIKNCREAEEFEELHEVMNLCFEQDADVRPNVSQLRDLLENLWYQNDVWDTTL